MDLIVTGDNVIDRYNDYSGAGALYISDDKIESFEKQKADPDSVDKNARFIDAGDKIISPGLVDMHVHLREPGREDEETIITGCEAASAGGFTAVCCMPNTRPVIDSQEVVRFILSRSRFSSARVFVIGSISRDLDGKQLSEIGDMVDAGIVAITDDGKSVMNAQLMRNGMEYAGMFGIPVISHAEDMNLSKNGKVNEGYISTVLGIKGIPSIAEDIIVARDIYLSKFTNTPIHIAHISTKGSVNLVREAKEEGIIVTAEATPHHFSLTDELLRSFDTNLIVNPPIRTQADVDALHEGLKDGTIDCVASDHAPHSPEEKDVEFNQAPFGMLGLETSVGLSLTYLVHKGVLTIEGLLEKMTVNPTRILKLPYNGFQAGSLADVTIIDPDLEWIVDASKFRSKSRNSPYVGYKLRGKAVCTICNGKVVYSENSMG
ncbi:MAG: amidohydrolase family protein [candidate division Zixibacteria bacterium]|nr:amidohydrolase family protein [candidate division Zixibacteria bacterium]